MRRIWRASVSTRIFLAAHRETAARRLSRFQEKPVVNRVKCRDIIRLVIRGKEFIL